MKIKPHSLLLVALLGTHTPLHTSPKKKKYQTYSQHASYLQYLTLGDQMLTKICTERTSLKAFFLFSTGYKLIASVKTNTSPLCYEVFFQQDIRINSSHYMTSKTSEVLQINTSANRFRYNLKTSTRNKCFQKYSAILFSPRLYLKSRHALDISPFQLNLNLPCIVKIS